MDIRMKVDPDVIRAAVRRVVTELLAESETLRRSKGILGVLAAIPHVIGTVEKIGAELRLLGEDKKAIAVQAVLALVPDRWVPDWVLEPIVGFAIDRAVAAFNRQTQSAS